MVPRRVVAGTDLDLTRARGVVDSERKQRIDAAHSEYVILLFPATEISRPPDPSRRLPAKAGDKSGVKRPKKMEMPFQSGYC